MWAGTQTKEALYLIELETSLQNYTSCNKIVILKVASTGNISADNTCLHRMSVIVAPLHTFEGSCWQKAPRKVSPPPV